METGNQHQDAHWLRWLLALWLLMAVVLVAFRWQNIEYFILVDTDDNLRLAQVKAWLGGQGWYDLRQYRLNPPLGADIHWSRLPDLPIAALIVGLTPLFGPVIAQQVAIGIAPLLPFGLALFALGLTVRRAVAPGAWAFAGALLFCAPSALGMYVPTRIDHHGWQLAFLALALAGLTDENRRRGGITTGLATAASLSVGLEMLPVLALLGGMIVVPWIVNGMAAARMRLYGNCLAAGTAFGFLVFASEANRIPRCDALSPVWLSTMCLAGLLLFALGGARLRSPQGRLALATLAGAILIAFFVSFWPSCLTRPEGLSDTLYRQWFVNITEVRPIYKHDLKTALTALALPVSGLVGSLWMAGRAPVGKRLLWLQLAFVCLLSTALMFWQFRAAPAAQVLAIPGAAALAWQIIPHLSRSRHFAVRVFGVIGAFLLVSGVIVQVVIALIPAAPAKDDRRGLARRASAQCTTLSALRPIGKLPAGTVFTFVDLSPRLIAMTHHSAIAGPYHRNGNAIEDVFRVFRGAPESARQILTAHRANYVLICPNMAEANNHLRAGPQGLLARLQQGKVPGWLEPVPLPANSPFKMWKIKPAS